MTSQAQIQANRQNAQHSTGPATPQGKAASSRNATSHGLATAHFCILPGEDPQAYADTLDQYVATFRPIDCHELHLIEIMVQSKWKLHRIQLIETALVAQMMDDDPTFETPAQAIAAALLDGTAGPYKTLQRYQAAAERSYNRAFTQLTAYGKERPLPESLKSRLPQPEKPPVPNEPKPETSPEVKAFTANVTKEWPAAYQAYKASGKDLIAYARQLGIVTQDQPAAA